MLQKLIVLLLALFIAKYSSAQNATDILVKSAANVYLHNSSATSIQIKDDDNRNPFPLSLWSLLRDRDQTHTAFWTHLKPRLGFLPVKQFWEEMRQKCVPIVPVVGVGCLTPIAISPPLPASSWNSAELAFTVLTNQVW